MAESQNIEVKVTGETKELIIRSGEALEPVHPETVHISAAITAPASYAHMRGHLIDWDKAHVIVNRLKGVIRFQEDEKNHFGTMIAGTLRNNPELDEFKINQNYFYTLKGLIQFLNMRRAFFLNRDAHTELIKTMMAFSAKIETEIQAIDDKKGNSANAVVKRLTTSMQLSLNLNIPLYIGFPAVSFPVEIYTDVTDSSIRFYLESIELREMMITERDRIIEDQLAAFEGSCVVIEE